MCLVEGEPRNWIREQKYICSLVTLKARGGIFYNPKDKKVFVLTHATFLENEYMNDFKSRSKLLLEELIRVLII